MAVLSPCARCGHSADDHRLDSTTDTSPVDPAAKFCCVGHQASDERWIDTDCDCPDYVKPMMSEPSRKMLACELSGHLRDYRDGRCTVNQRQPDNSPERYCTCPISTWGRIDGS